MKLSKRIVDDGNGNVVIDIGPIPNRAEEHDECRKLTIEKSASDSGYYFTYHEGLHSRIGGHADKIILKVVDTGEFEVLYQ